MYTFDILCNLFSCFTLQYYTMKSHFSNSNFYSQPIKPNKPSNMKETRRAPNVFIMWLTDLDHLGNRFRAQRIFAVY